MADSIIRDSIKRRALFKSQASLKLAFDSMAAISSVNVKTQWRGQKLGLEVAVVQFWLKSPINIKLLQIKC